MIRIKRGLLFIRGLHYQGTYSKSSPNAGRHEHIRAVLVAIRSDPRRRGHLSAATNLFGAYFGAASTLHQSFGLMASGLPVG